MVQRTIVKWHRAAWLEDGQWRYSRVTSEYLRAMSAGKSASGTRVGTRVGVRVIYLHAEVQPSSGNFTVDSAHGEIV